MSPPYQDRPQPHNVLIKNFLLQELRDVLSQATHNIVSAIDTRQQNIKVLMDRFKFRSRTFSAPRVDIIANSDCTSCEEEITDLLTEQTLLALKMFVNDHLNELDFALRHVAPTFLKPENGILLAIAQSVSKFSHFPYSVNVLIAQFQQYFVKFCI